MQTDDQKEGWPITVIVIAAITLTLVPTALWVYNLITYARDESWKRRWHEDTALFSQELKKQAAVIAAQQEQLQQAAAQRRQAEAQPLEPKAPAAPDVPSAAKP